MHLSYISLLPPYSFFRHFDHLLGNRCKMKKFNDLSRVLSLPLEIRLEIYNHLPLSDLYNIEVANKRLHEEIQRYLSLRETQRYLRKWAAFKISRHQKESGFGRFRHAMERFENLTSDPCGRIQRVMIFAPLEFVHRMTYLDTYLVFGKSLLRLEANGVKSISLAIGLPKDRSQESINNFKRQFDGMMHEFSLNDGSGINLHRIVICVPNLLREDKLYRELVKKLKFHRRNGGGAEVSEIWIPKYTNGRRTRYLEPKSRAAEWLSQVAGVRGVRRSWETRIALYDSTKDIADHPSLVCRLRPFSRYDTHSWFFRASNICLMIS